jgi:hypothetical protein
MNNTRRTFLKKEIEEKGLNFIEECLKSSKFKLVFTVNNKK